MRKFEENLSNLLENEKKLGLYTEFFVEGGYLGDSEPKFSLGNSRSIFDLASLTKALITGPLVYDKWRSNLEIPLIEWVNPNLSLNFSKKTLERCLKDLLAHRSGFPAWRNFWVTHLNEGPSSPAMAMNALIPRTFQRIEPSIERKDIYSDLGYILLGYVLEAESNGRRLDELWTTYAQGIGFASTRLGFATNLQETSENFVTSAYCAVRGRWLKGEVHDENSAALGGVSGHAGAFSRGPDLGLYLRSLFQSAEGHSYFEANEKERRVHAFEGLLGLRRGNGTSAELFANGEALGHLGFVGTAFWCDLKSGRYGIFLTNRVISSRLSPRITSLRREVFGQIHDILKQ